MNHCQAWHLTTEPGRTSGDTCSPKSNYFLLWETERERENERKVPAKEAGGGHWWWGTCIDERMSNGTLYEWKPIMKSFETVPHGNSIFKTTKATFLLFYYYLVPIVPLLAPLVRNVFPLLYTSIISLHHTGRKDHNIFSTKFTLLSALQRE